MAPSAHALAKFIEHSFKTTLTIVILPPKFNKSFKNCSHLLNIDINS